MFPFLLTNFSLDPPLFWYINKSYNCRGRKVFPSFCGRHLNSCVRHRSNRKQGERESRSLRETFKDLQLGISYPDGQGDLQYRSHRMHNSIVVCPHTTTPTHSLLKGCLIISKIKELPTGAP